MRRATTRLAVAAFLAVGALSAQAAPLPYIGGTITQNFDGLPTNVTNPTQTIAGRGPHEFSLVNAATGMDGWQLANPSGSSTSTEFKSHNGSLAGSSGRGVISYGSNGSTERALGALATSNQINTFGLVLVNNSNTTYSGFDLSYTGEQWRRGDVTTPNTLAFAYGEAASIGGTLTSFPALGFSSPVTGGPTEVALDGNLPANQVAVAGTVTGLDWAPGETLVLRWSINDLSGQDDGLGIDNLSFVAHPVPEPSTIALGAAALVGLALAARRRV